jgi:hypothetical protein
MSSVGFLTGEPGGVEPVFGLPSGSDMMIVDSRLDDDEEEEE